MSFLSRTLLLGLGAFAIATTSSIAASAHIELLSPTPRYSDLKEGPCGKGGSLDVRGTNVTTFKPGEKITVKWKETIGHPGHYRISFDANGQSAFVDPKSFTDLNTAPSVMVDNIADKSGLEEYTQEITLPNVECDKCTLQVIQVMTDKPPYGDGNDLYYQCADLVLSNTAPATDTDAGTGGGAGTGTGTGAGTGAGNGTGGGKASKAATPSSSNSGCTTTNSPAGPEAAILALAVGAFVTALRKRLSRSRG